MLTIIQNLVLQLSYNTFLFRTAKIHTAVFLVAAPLNYGIPAKLTKAQSFGQTTHYIQVCVSVVFVFKLKAASKDWSKGMRVLAS